MQVRPDKAGQNCKTVRRAAFKENAYLRQGGGGFFVTLFSFTLLHIHINLLKPAVTRLPFTLSLQIKHQPLQSQIAHFKTLPPTASRKQLSENDGQDMRIILQPSLFFFRYKNNDVLG